jgi:hypothetical protein
MTSTTAPATKVDLYRPPDTPVRVTVPPQKVLMVDGQGDPNTSPDYAAAVGTLYALSYGVRSIVKQAGGTPWKVMPLEGLWWAPDMSAFTDVRHDEWLWTMMISQPPEVTAELVATALAAAVAKHRAPAARLLRFEEYDEGDCVQVMHHGPYAEEGPTIAALHAAIAHMGLALRGTHHEIYLSDPRRVAPEKMRTIVRQPVAER